jgi:hypothetical protein
VPAMLEKSPVGEYTSVPKIEKSSAQEHVIRAQTCSVEMGAFCPGKSKVLMTLSWHVGVAAYG